MQALHFARESTSVPRFNIGDNQRIPPLRSLLYRTHTNAAHMYSNFIRTSRNQISEPISTSERCCGSFTHVSICNWTKSGLFNTHLVEDRGKLRPRAPRLRCSTACVIFWIQSSSPPTFSLYCSSWCVSRTCAHVYGNIHQSDNKLNALYICISTLNSRANFRKANNGAIHFVAFGKYQIQAKQTQAAQSLHFSL